MLIRYLYLYNNLKCFIYEKIKTKYNVNDGIDELIKFIKSNKFENKSLFGNYNIDKNEK